MELAHGVVIRGTYRLEHELGRGTMGAVWLATHLPHQAPVAIKVMNEPAAGDTTRFALEAETLAAVTSPHVVRVSDFGTCEAGEPFFAMEVLRGHDLKEHIEAHAPLPMAEVLTLLRQVGGALDEVHRAHVVHRDIKPANIFVVDTPDGSLFAKVLDFGVAKHMDAGLGMTATGMMVGTPYYASPEQLIDPRSVDHRTDLWSLAVVTYACLTGQLPFVADNLTGLCLLINSAHYTPLTELRPDLPPALDGWMRRALAREPSARFASAVELASGFHDAMQHEPKAELPLATMMMTSGGATLNRSMARPSAMNDEPALGTLALEPTMSTVALSTLAPTLAASSLGVRPAIGAPISASTLPSAVAQPAPALGTMAMATVPGQPALARGGVAAMDASLSPTTQSAGTPGITKPRRSALGWMSAATVLLLGGLAATWWWQRPTTAEGTAPAQLTPASNDEPAPQESRPAADPSPPASSSTSLPTDDGPASDAGEATRPDADGTPSTTPPSPLRSPRIPPIAPPRPPPAPRPRPNNNPFGGKRL